MVHSGSRNLGKKVCDHHTKIAKELNAKYHSSVPPSWDLAFLPAQTPEAQSYIQEMNYCINFAYHNRRQISIDIGNILWCIFSDAESINNMGYIDVAHNYARLENHFGKNVWVHRKGATLASKGTIGIIPGSQGSSSFIVEGLGNKDSFMSCSHGAGRTMSRSKARENLSLDEEIKRLDDLGIIHGIRTESDLDEAAGAYKDITSVMAAQEDLVKIVHTLKPLAVIKG